MGLFDKIQKYGFVGSLRRAPRSLMYRADAALYRRAYERYQKEPVDERLIVLESEGDLSDNAYALYDYMREAGYLERYRVVWAVDDLEAAWRLKEAEPERWPNTEFVRKYPSGLPHGGVNYACARALATCRWFVYDHNNLMAQFNKREGQTVAYLSHGCGYKAPKGSNLAEGYSNTDLFTSTGELGSQYLANFTGLPSRNAKVTGYPRNDYLLADNALWAMEADKAFRLSDYDHVILWMPTFRQSIESSLSENYMQSATGLPIVGTVENLQRLSVFLRNSNALLILKLHHLQAENPVFKENFDNIIIMKDKDLADAGLQLYQFIGLSDLLITDYSSVAVDYLLLDRPIIYTLDDYEQYAHSRGFFPENALEHMPGSHVTDLDGLLQALTEIASGIDRYKTRRSQIVGRYHTYRDANSAERVLAALGIHTDTEEMS